MAKERAKIATRRTKHGEAVDNSATPAVIRRHGDRAAVDVPSGRELAKTTNPAGGKPVGLVEMSENLSLVTV